MADVNFGPNQVKHPTPAWANNAFQAVVLLTTVTTFVIGASGKIPNDIKVEIGIYLKALDMVCFGLAKMFGVQIADNAKVSPKDVDVMENK